MSKKSSGDGEIAASVEETNEMRKKLGMKPLDVDSGPKTASGKSYEDGGAAAKKKEPTAADIKASKVAAKNRKVHEDLTSGKGIADILRDEEGPGGSSASDWINRSKGSDGKMKMAANAAAAAKDDKAKKKKEAEAPSAKVRHDMSQLPEGQGTILTLSDQSILNADGEINDAEDELSNVRMNDLDRAKHLEAVKNQKEYDPTKDGAKILDKYDDLDTGPKGFMLIGGSTVVGTIAEDDPEKKLSMLTQLSEKNDAETKLKLQSDFYTSEEMAGKFRKPKKKVKKRARPDGKKGGDDEDLPTAKGASMAAKLDDQCSDEEDPELYEQLTKQRRLVKASDKGAVPKGEAALSNVSDKITNSEPSNPAADTEKAVEKKGKKGAEEAPADPMSMTATTEFCNIVQTPLEKMDTMKHESFRGSTLYKQQAQTRKGLKVMNAVQQKKKTRGQREVNLDEPEEEETIDELVEESLDLTCASGLQYLRARSQIGMDQESHFNRKSDNRPLEMSTTDGDIKLEYRDDYGRVQTPKEAFRAISWKFHGKMPGKKNLERRLSRLENEMRLKSMDVQNQLPTLKALKHVQTSDAKPYMLLSGANEK
eukprot:gnl/TRDRNA2_/TRDRNA2_180206_c0_seq1.p1 gnl/TRDRNA2_/TRDRNA2_180206_c0~~gnl/TRDRNA2_/TRDRNA2_180206_c0_seq1.p1  ORF type:complete len:595 (+),score=209.99 gnl/TRDRNA2_/TRDRNA2_180206_c0_seq1:85-1869(+)